MSHTVTVTMISDQEITVDDKVVNVYDIRTIVVDGHGQIVEVRLCPPSVDSEPD